VHPWYREQQRQHDRGGDHGRADAARRDGPTRQDGKTTRRPNRQREQTADGHREPSDLDGAGDHQAHSGVARPGLMAAPDPELPACLPGEEPPRDHPDPSVPGR